MTTSSSCTLLSIAGLHVFKQPVPGVTPHALHGANFQTERLGASSPVSPRKYFTSTSVHHFPLRFRELLQKLVDGDGQVQLCARGGKQVSISLERDETPHWGARAHGQ